MNDMDYDVIGIQKFRVLIFVRQCFLISSLLMLNMQVSIKRLKL